MDRDKTIFGKNRTPDKRGDSGFKRDYKKRLIVKAPATVVVTKEYLNVKKPDREITISIFYLYSVFLQRGVKISLYDMDALARKCRVYITDGRGSLLGRYIRYEKI